MLFRQLMAGALALLFTLFAAGCGDSTAYADARDQERKILMANPEANYADPSYLRVAQRLTEVPRSSADYDKAHELLGRIQDARRLQVGEVYGLSYTPSRLEGVALSSFKPETEGVAPVQPKVVSVPPQRVAGKSAPASGEPALASAAGSGGGQIILYGTSWCGYCKKARSYFQRNGIDFVDKDIERDASAAAELRRKVGGSSGVPVIDIDGTVIRGYDLPSIKRALAMRETGPGPQ